MRNSRGATRLKNKKNPKDRLVESKVKRKIKILKPGNPEARN